MMHPHPGPMAVASSTDSGRSSTKMALSRKEWAPPEWMEISRSATGPMAAAWAAATRSLRYPSGRPG